ncbi:DsbA family protein [Arvimicrobium flavum]|uniref:DsbA family protein n=1 Tax=Arvimicrobium flavum TaxID=3393320 RepID=UPI00398D0786
MTRRALIGGVMAGALVGLAPSASADDVSREMILNDPAAPTSGNPKGDVTIVSFFDYNCPFCKQAMAPLASVMKSDGNIRLVYKDWPILTEASVYGAKAALAAHYQGKYEAVHEALMSIEGRRVGEERMRQAIEASGVDMTRLEGDAKKHDAEITALIRRNGAQADALGLQGTPVYLIGPFMVASALDEMGFRQVVKDARESVQQ